MALLNVQLLSGPGSGRSVTFTESPITFGRDVDNVLVLNEAAISRKHGQIEFADGQWLLHNLSVNGTKLNSKLVQKKPTRMRSGDTIAVGSQPLLKVTFDESALAPDTGKVEPIREKMSSKNKLMLGLGTFWGICAVVILIAWVVSIFADPRPTVVDDRPAQLTDQQIEREILTPLPFDTVRNPQVAASQLQQANEMAPRAKAVPDLLFRAYDHYQQALAAAHVKTFGDRYPLADDQIAQLGTPVDQVTFLDIQQKLIDEVTTRYNKAWNLGESHQDAQAAWESVFDLYARPSSVIYKNTMDHQRRALRKIQEQKPSGGF